MPSVNIITNNESNVKQIEQNYAGLSQIIAKELTCPERTVEKEHIRINVLVNSSSFQSADTRIEMYAQNYKGRTENGKEMSICDNVHKYMTNNCSTLGSVDVFLYLVEVGYNVTKLENLKK